MEPSTQQPEQKSRRPIRAGFVVGAAVFIVVLLALLAINARKPAPVVLPPSPKPPLLNQETVTIPEVVERVLPSVVTVGIRRPDGGPFSLEQSDERNIGSGFVASDDGLIITNRHVVSEDSAEYVVMANDGKEYRVENIYRDSQNDLAILKVGAQGLQPLPLGEVSGVRLGQPVIAVGTPLGVFTNTVTFGIVSGLGRGITAGSSFQGFAEELTNIIQTDAAISPGNSGGPLVDTAGRVIGVNTAVATSGENIGFAIPADAVAELLSTFRKRGSGSSHVLYRIQ
jgi:putative serine protease PepD